MNLHNEACIHRPKCIARLLRRRSPAMAKRRWLLGLPALALLTCGFGCFPVSALCASPGSAGDEQALRDTISRMESAWARHSAADVNQFYTEDADVVIPPGNRFSGRAALKQESEKEFAGIFKHATFAYSLKTIRFVRPDVAIVDASFEFQGSTINPAPKRPDDAGDGQGKPRVAHFSRARDDPDT